MNTLKVLVTLTIMMMLPLQATAADSKYRKFDSRTVKAIKELPRVDITSPDSSKGAVQISGNTVKVMASIPDAEKGNCCAVRIYNYASYVLKGKRGAKWVKIEDKRVSASTLGKGYTRDMNELRAQAAKYLNRNKNYTDHVKVLNSGKNTQWKVEVAPLKDTNSSLIADVALFNFKKSIPVNKNVARAAAGSSGNSVVNSNVQKEMIKHGSKLAQMNIPRIRNINSGPEDIGPKSIPGKVFSGRRFVVRGANVNNQHLLMNYEEEIKAAGYSYTKQSDGYLKPEFCGDNKECSLRQNKFVKVQPEGVSIGIYDVGAPSANSKLEFKPDGYSFAHLTAVMPEISSLTNGHEYEMRVIHANEKVQQELVSAQVQQVRMFAQLKNAKSRSEKDKYRKQISSISQQIKNIKGKRIYSNPWKVTLNQQTSKPELLSTDKQYLVPGEEFIINGKHFHSGYACLALVTKTGFGQCEYVLRTKANGGPYGPEYSLISFRVTLPLDIIPAAYVVLMKPKYDGVWQTAGAIDYFKDDEHFAEFYEWVKTKAEQYTPSAFEATNALPIMVKPFRYHIKLVNYRVNKMQKTGWAGIGSDADEPKFYTRARADYRKTSRWTLNRSVDKTGEYSFKTVGGHVLKEEVQIFPDPKTEPNLEYIPIVNSLNINMVGYEWDGIKYAAKGCDAGSSTRHTCAPQSTQSIHDQIETAVNGFHSNASKVQSELEKYTGYLKEAQDAVKAVKKALDAVGVAADVTELSSAIGSVTTIATSANAAVGTVLGAVAVLVGLVESIEDPEHDLVGADTYTINAVDLQKRVGSSNMNGIIYQRFKMNRKHVEGAPDYEVKVMIKLDPAQFKKVHKSKWFCGYDVTDKAYGKDTVKPACNKWKHAYPYI